MAPWPRGRTLPLRQAQNNRPLPVPTLSPQSAEGSGRGHGARKHTSHRPRRRSAVGKPVHKLLRLGRARAGVGGSTEGLQQPRLATSSWAALALTSPVPLLPQGSSSSGSDTSERDKVLSLRPSEPLCLLRVSSGLDDTVGLSRRLRPSWSAGAWDLRPGVLRFLCFSGAGRGFNTFCADKLDF